MGHFYERARHERAKVVEKSRAAIERGDCSGAVSREAMTKSQMNKVMSVVK
ncbi:hypothetical protein [Slackia heliotrinireducens]|uniref:hypothetical protein n=1 Tax=Slackia heliotrinireducens TaxID=84110 RepID=UPI003314AB3A